MRGMRWPLLVVLGVWVGGVGVSVPGALGQTERCAQAGGLELCLDQAFPKEGEPCLIRVTDREHPVRGARLRVTYRPNSEVETIERLGATNAEGELVWIPDDAGIATLEAGLASVGSQGEQTSLNLTVSVRFRSSPALGIVILLLAGMILFGGNGYSFAKTFGRT